MINERLQFKLVENMYVLGKMKSPPPPTEQKSSNIEKKKETINFRLFVSVIVSIKGGGRAKWKSTFQKTGGWVDIDYDRQANRKRQEVEQLSWLIPKPNTKIEIKLEDITNEL